MFNKFFLRIVNSLIFAVSYGLLFIFVNFIITFLDKQLSYLLSVTLFFFVISLIFYNKINLKIPRIGGEEDDDDEIFNK